MCNLKWSICEFISKRKHKESTLKTCTLFVPEEEHNSIIIWFRSLVCAYHQRI